MISGRSRLIRTTCACLARRGWRRRARRAAAARRAARAAPAGSAPGKVGERSRKRSSRQCSSRRAARTSSSTLRETRQSSAPRRCLSTNRRCTARNASLSATPVRFADPRGVRRKVLRRSSGHVCVLAQRRGVCPALPRPCVLFAHRVGRARRRRRPTACCRSRGSTPVGRVSDRSVTCPGAAAAQGGTAFFLGARHRATSRLMLAAKTLHASGEYGECAT